MKPISVANDRELTRLLDSGMSLDEPACPDGWVNFYRSDDYSAPAFFTPLHGPLTIAVRLNPFFVMA